MTQSTATATSAPTILHTDPEHEGLRTAIFALLFASLVVSFLIINLVLRRVETLGEYAFALSCIGAWIPALGIIYAAERIMKANWPSGRKLEIDPAGVRLINGEEAEASLPWAENLVKVTWFFRLKGYPRGGRERRVPANWLCLACQLRQEDERITVYTYMPASDAEALTDNRISRHGFHQIFPADIYDNSLKDRFTAPQRPEIPTEILGGKHGRYWLAERRRWRDGAELIPDDFKTFMQILSSRNV